MTDALHNNQETNGNTQTEAVLEKNTFNQEEALEFFATNKQIIPEASQEDYRKLHQKCIDDREKDGEFENVPRIGIPGAQLGVFIDVVAGLVQSEIPFDITDLFEIVESKIGMSFHTDDKHVHDPLSCAGCGYCSGSLKNPSAFLLNTTSTEAIERILHQLHNRGMRPEVYKGSHKAKAVFVIDDKKTALKSYQSDGVQAFVYNRAHHYAILKVIADDENIQTSTGQNAESLLQMFKKAAEVRVQVTLDHLAEDLPMYVFDGVELA